LDLEAITASLRVQSGNFVAFRSFRENTSDFTTGSSRKTEKSSDDLAVSPDPPDAAGDRCNAVLAKN